MKTKILAPIFTLLLLGGHLYGAAIQGVTINAVSSEYTSAADQRRATNMINGVGLFGDAQCSTAPGAMWLTLPSTPSSSVAAAFVTFDLGSVHNINRMRVWNYNEAQSGANILTRRGVKTADISIAGEDQIFTTNIAGQTFARASGFLSNASDIVTMNVAARYIRFNVKTNYNTTEGDFRVGLSKVQFIDDTVPPTVKLATRSFSGSQLTVQFSESVLPSTATNIANYSITGGATNALVLSAVMGIYNDTVVLQTSVMDTNAAYTLALQSVRDAANIISITNTQISIDRELVLWLKADVGVTADISGNVSQWDDQSGLGNNAVAVSAPTLVTGAVNGQPSVHFNGSMVMEVAPNATLAANRDLTVYTVINLDTLATPAQSPISKCLANIPATFDVQTVVTTGKPSIVRGNGSGFTSFSGSTAPLTSGQYYIMSSVTRGTNATHYLNGNFNGSGNIFAGLNDAGTPIRLGMRADNLVNLRGSLAEVFVLRGAVTDAERSSIDSYLGTKYGISVIALAITGQPQNANRLVGQTATFGVTAVSGSPTLLYQWQSNSVNISGATNANYTTPPLTLSYNASAYNVIVSTPLGVNTNSTAATLAVTTDNQPPTIFSATRATVASTNSIVVFFSEPVTAVTATNLANYTLDNGASVVGAVVGSSSNIVALTTTALTPGTLYKLTAQNIQDAFANTMVSSSASVLPPTVVLLVRADSGVVADGSNLVGEMDDQSTNKNNALQYNSVLRRPTLVAGAMNGRPVIRFDGISNFLEAASTSSLALTGDMSIYVAANFTDFATGREIIGKTQGNQPAPFDYYVPNTSPTHLYRGNGLVNASHIATASPSAGATHTLGVTMQGTNVSQYLDGVLNGSGGLATTIADAGTSLRIGSRNDLLQYMKGDLAEVMIFSSALSANDRKIVDTYLGIRYFPITFTSQPADTNVVEGTTATFSVGVTAGGATFGYQWQKNLTNIPGATNATYTTPILFQSDSGSTYRAVVLIPGGGTTNSTSATLTVHADTDAPTVIAVGKKFWSQSEIVVVFSEPVDPASALTPGNYALDNGGIISGVTAGSASNLVVLTTSGLNPATLYSLTVQGVKDLFNNTMVMSTTPSGFYPPSLALWLKADAGVTTDPGNLVNGWSDQSGNGNNAFQPGGTGVEPTLVTNGLGGQPVIRFDPNNSGATNYLVLLSSPSLAITGDLTIYTVAKFTDFAQPREIIGKTTINQPASYDYYVSAVPTTRLYRGNGTVNATITGTAPTVGVAHVMGVTMLGTSVTHFLDGKTNGTGTLAIAMGDNGDAIGIGARSDLTQFMKGDIAEIMVLSSALSTADRGAIDSYLATKYGILFGPAPTISLQPNNTAFTLSWLTPNVSFSLEASASLSTPAWSPVTNQVTTLTGTNSVTINFGSGQTFYRLHKQ